MLANRSVRAVLAAAIAVVIGVVAYLAGNSRADAEETATTPNSGITVLGTGTVSGTPDVLRLHLSVAAGRSSVEAALDAANRTMRTVRGSLQDNDVAERDLKTSGLSVRPNYDYTSSGRVLRGYRASESLVARLRNIDTAGRIISAAVAAGGNAVRVNGIDLDLSADSRLTKAARDEAFEDAKAKAEQYAAAAGRSLGAVQTISEDVVESPVDGRYSFNSGITADSAAALRSVPIEAGTQRVSVNVVASWSLA